MNKSILIVSVVIVCNIHAKGFADLIDAPKKLIECAHYNQKAGRPSYDKYGAKPSKGILLVGGPGSGKTAMAIALNEEIECGQMLYHNMEFKADLPKLFSDARNQANNSPLKSAVIFLDQFDKISPADQAIIQEELDGFKKNNESITVIAATNKLDSFSETLVRSGRLDTSIDLGLPNKETREKLLQKFCVKTGQVSFASIDMKRVSLLMDSFTPADIKEVVNQAKLLAKAEAASSINQSHLINGIKEVLKFKGIWNKDLAIKIQAIMNTQNQKKGFATVVGNIPAEVKQLADQIKGTDTRFARFNLKTPKGFLFTGPPGTGKTSLTRALAEETGCAFISMNAGEINGGIVGSGAATIKKLFSDARALAASSDAGIAVVFIDEIDALGKRQGNPLDSTINQLLTEMDGVIEDKSIVVIGATNHTNNVDSALKRAGRLSKTIRIGLPNTKDREELVKFYLDKKPTKNLNLPEVAKLTANFSQSDMKELVNQACSIAIDENAANITQDHMVKGIRRAIEKRLNDGDKDARQMLDALEVATSANSQKGFKAIAGGVPQEINDLLDMINNRGDFSKYGLKTPKGFLFTGPPGTGKTALAKAVAEEAGCPFIETKGSEFVNQFVGVGADNVRKVFEKARQMSEGSDKPTILFIDEIDSIGARGNGLDGGETSRTVTELLTQLDGFNKDNVIVIAATNNPQSLDAALKRPGRLDKMVNIGLPDKDKRVAILNLYLKNRPFDKSVNVSLIADKTQGYSAAALKDLVDQAANIARKLKSNIKQAHFDVAIANVSQQNNIRSANYL